MAETPEQLAWRQVGFKAGRAGDPYDGAVIGKRVGSSAEIKYAEGYRVGKRERLREPEDYLTQEELA